MQGASALPGQCLPAWQGQPLHVVADTGFGNGLNFLRLWRAWRDDPTRSDRLHCAATVPQAPRRADLLQAAGAHPGLAGLAAELAAHWPDPMRPDPLRPGCQVFPLDAGRVTLTLHIGEQLPVLQSWRFLTDTVWLSETWTPEVLRAVARLSHQQTRLHANSASAGFHDALAHAGFTVTPNVNVNGHADGTANTVNLTAHYAPRWPAPRMPQRAPGQATILGAGLAGAALCRALGRRGWTLSLLDHHSGPAQGTSSLPVGLLAPHQTAEPTPMSRLTEAGAHWMGRELRRLLPEGAGWQAGVVRQNLAQPPEWRPDAMQVTPAALVQAWLDEAQGTGRLTTAWGGRASRLQKHQGHWQLTDDAGQVWHEASTLLLASAWGSQSLLAPWGGDALALSPVRGQLSLGRVSDLAPGTAPQHATHGGGVLVPHCHWQGQDHWVMGATYERGESAVQVSEANHQANLAALQAWLPDVAAVLAPSFHNHQVSGWAQIRCATGDRLPLAGALPDVAALQNQQPVHQQPRLDGLHALTGLGSRGLTLALLCAEVLAARLAQEPLPVPADLADALDPARFALRQRRRNG